MFITVFTTARNLSLSSGQMTAGHTLPSYVSKTNFNIILPSRPFFKLVSFPKVSPPQPFTHFSPPPYMPHVPPISSFCIWLTELYLVPGTNHEASQCAVFSSVLLPAPPQPSQSVPLISQRHKARQFCVSAAGTAPVQSGLISSDIFVSWQNGPLALCRIFKGSVLTYLLWCYLHCARHLPTVTTHSQPFVHATLQCHHAKYTPPNSLQGKEPPVPE